MAHESVHLVPDPNYFIPGVPHVEQDVTPERAAELLAYTPAAFHIQPPEARPAEEPSPEE